MFFFFFFFCYIEAPTCISVFVRKSICPTNATWCLVDTCPGEYEDNPSAMKIGNSMWREKVQVNRDEDPFKLEMKWSVFGPNDGWIQT